MTTQLNSADQITVFCLFNIYIYIYIADLIEIAVAVAVSFGIAVGDSASELEPKGLIGWPKPMLGSSLVTLEKLIM